MGFSLYTIVLSTHTGLKRLDLSLVYTVLFHGSVVAMLLILRCLSTEFHCAIYYYNATYCAAGCLVFICALYYLRKHSILLAFKSFSAGMLKKYLKMGLLLNMPPFSVYILANLLVFIIKGFGIFAKRSSQSLAGSLTGPNSVLRRKIINRISIICIAWAFR